MDNWFKPLPFETAISTLMGSVLSYTFSQQQISELKSWKEVGKPIIFFAAILAYILMMNLFCRAYILKDYRLICFLSPGMLGTAIVFLFLWPGNIITPGEAILFTPDKFVVFSLSLLLLWFTALFGTVIVCQKLGVEV